MSLSRLLTHDTWSDDLSSASAWKRAKEIPDIHFADFAAYIVGAMGRKTESLYIPFRRCYCDKCNELIMSSCNPSTVRPQRHSCVICTGGLYDLCSSCYECGNRCLDDKHQMVLRPFPSLQYHFDYASYNRLKAAAGAGSAKRFSAQVREASRGSTFFCTGEGWIGIGTRAMEAGDVVAVLFGGRVPFILRKQSSGYRVVGACYVHGLMDGEAVDMFKNGQLAEEEFELR